MNKNEETDDEFLSRIRKTIADSRDLVARAELRIAETDRMLADQGLTREEVLNFKFTPEQRLAVNEEMRRRGLPAFEEDGETFDFDAATAAARAEQFEIGGESASGDVVMDRQRKFGNFMQAYRL